MAAKFDDDDDSGGATSKDEREDMKNAVKMNMFGTITRTKVPWRPDRILCKRFNVPVPYEGGDPGTDAASSDAAGAPTDKPFAMKDLFANMKPAPAATKTEPAQPLSIEANPTTSSSSSSSGGFTSAFSDSAPTAPSLEFPTSSEPAAESAVPMEEVFETDDVITKHLKVKRNEVTKIAIKLKATSSQAYVPPGPTEKDKEEEDQSAEEKPDRDLFKAIFESDDDDSSEEEEEEEEEKEEIDKDKGDNKVDDELTETPMETHDPPSEKLVSDSEKRKKMLLENYGSLGETGGGIVREGETSSDSSKPLDLPTKITFSYSKSKKSLDGKKDRPLKPAGKMSFLGSDDDEDNDDLGGNNNHGDSSGEERAQQGSNGSTTITTITSSATSKRNQYCPLTSLNMNDKSEAKKNGHPNEEAIGDDDNDDDGSELDFGPSLPIDLNCQSNGPSGNWQRQSPKVDDSSTSKSAKEKKEKKKKKHKSKERKKEKKKLKKSKKKKKTRHFSDSDSSSSSD